MKLTEIKPFHFAFFEKKLLKQDYLIELYYENELINDLNVLKTISKYSEQIVISKRTKENIFIYTDKKCFKFKPKNKTCFELVDLFVKFIDCSFLDCLLLNSDSIFYCFSRLNPFEYSVSLLYSLENNYKDYLVVNVFDNPKSLFGEFKFVDLKDNLNFKIDDLEIDLLTVNEVETTAIDIPEGIEKQRVVKHFEIPDLLTRVMEMFKSKRLTKKHFIRFGSVNGDRLICRTKPIRPVEFNKQSEVKKLVVDLITKMKTCSIDYIQIECDIQIFIVKNKGGIYIFVYYEVDGDCYRFVESVHNTFVSVIDSFD